MGLREIKAFCLGQLDFRLTVPGRLPDTSEISHIAFAHQADNPVDALMTIVGRLRALAERRAMTLRHPLLERSANLLVSHIGIGPAGVVQVCPHDDVRCTVVVHVPCGVDGEAEQIPRGGPGQVPPARVKAWSASRMRWE